MNYNEYNTWRRPHMDDQQRRLAEELLFGVQKKPSFAKRLYFGEFNGEHILPFPTIPEEEKERLCSLNDQFESFADRHLDPAQIDKESNIPEQVIRGLGKLGILGMTVPREYGGLGMTQHSYCKIAESIARRCGSTALFLNAHQSIGLKALLLFGTEEQRVRWLPVLARGELIAAFSLTEPNAGSDASGVETEAVFIPEKNVYRINGRKQWTTNGSIAGVLTVMAQVEVDTPSGRQKKVTAFLVTPGMPGFKVTAPALEKVGMRGSKTANLEFQDMDVPAGNILGTLGGGLKLCLSVLDYGRTTFGATCTGAAKAALERAIEYSRSRYQFKRPLGSFELVKKKIATMSALVYAMDASTYLTAGLVDAEVEDFMLESAILKVFCSDSLWTVLYETMQIYGGKSFFTDQPFERMMRDARLNMIGEGSNEVMRAFIGVVGMRDVGIYLKGTLDALANPFYHWNILGKSLTHWINRIKAPTVPLESPQLREMAAELGIAVRQFGLAVTRLLTKYREGIMEKQLLLDRIANCAIAIYTATAVLSKLDADLRRSEKSQSSTGNEIAIGMFYCRMANETFHHNLNGLWNNIDGHLTSLSDQITRIRYP